MPVTARKKKNKHRLAADSGQAETEQREDSDPVINTVLRPILSARRPAMPLVKAAMIIITENRLPAAIVEREKVWRISGRAMPKVATIIDGIRLEQGTMQSVRRCVSCGGRGFKDFR